MSRSVSRAILARLRRTPLLDARVQRAIDSGRSPHTVGSSLVFWWRGQADAVAIEHRVGGVPMPLPMQRGRGDIWHTELVLPAGARIEYRLLVRRGDAVENVLDPGNDAVAYGPVGEASFATVEGYEEPPWAQPDATAPRGALVEITLPSASLERDMRCTLHVPAQPSTAALPLVVVHDGTDFLRYSSLATVLDNLEHGGIMAPAIVAAVDPGDRLREYAANPSHTRFLFDELIPAIAQRYPLESQPDGLVIAGASFGAVASLAALVHEPGRARGVALMSASLRSSPDTPGVDETWAPVLRFTDSLRASHARVASRIFQSYGAFEPLAAPNRAITPVLREMADEVLTVCSLDGHNWTSWRDRFADAFAYLLPARVAAETREAATVGEGGRV